MTPYGRTLLVEVQRGFARRLTRVLALLFVLGFALGAFVNFRLDSANAPEPGEPVAVIVDGTTDPTPNALDLIELWSEEQEGDYVLAIALVPLLMASLIIGASLVGAEWKAGTVTTNLTWEPRRVRLASAKLLGAGIVTFLFTVALQLAFVALLLPNIATNGSFEGADGGWWWWFAQGVARGGILAAAAAMVGAALAMVGRNTTVALAAGFVIISILEPILRAWKGWTDRWLLTTNAFTVYLNDETPLADGTILSTTSAAVRLVAYLLVIAVVATFLFARRDVASTA